MENVIPLNGRIAIVDNNVDQALPLMSVLSRHNIPYVFYKGDDVKFLPENPENDIRILFLDLNLISERIEKEKDIRSVLYSVIKRIISPQNHPYVLILWSRQESEYSNVLEELFSNELKNCSPIIVANYIKSDFFPNFSQELDESVDDEKILIELKRILNTLPAYSYLMQWENHVHNSADSTIKNIFHDFCPQDGWHDNASYILDLFAHSYLDKHHGDASLEEKVKASLLFLNDVNYDTLELAIVNNNIEDAVKLEYKECFKQTNNIHSRINGYILMSKSQIIINQPGCIFTGSDSSVECVQCAKEILNNSLKTEDIRAQIGEKFYSNPQEAKKQYDFLMKERRNTIFQTLLACGVVVTPACDYAQKKAKYDRIIMGIIIDSCYKDFIDTKSEAIYVSPSFYDGTRERIMVLNYRYFMTQELSKVNGATPLFRVRNSILAEIQSKLARHISRQGVMTL